MDTSDIPASPLPPTPPLRLTDLCRACVDCEDYQLLYERIRRVQDFTDFNKDKNLHEVVCSSSSSGSAESSDSSDSSPGACPALAAVIEFSGAPVRSLLSAENCSSEDYVEFTFPSLEYGPAAPVLLRFASIHPDRDVNPMLTTLWRDQADSIVQIDMNRMGVGNDYWVLGAPLTRSLESIIVRMH